MSTNYATKESFETYIDYLSLKKHFSTDSYDYKKYNGKVKASFDKFQTRNDVFFFYKLSKKKNHHHILLSNLLKNPNAWIRDLCEDQAFEVYLDWKKKIDSLNYQFTSDLKKLKENYKENFTVINGQHPYLMTLFLQKQITTETFTILTNISNVFEYWEKEIVDKFIAKDIIKLSKKYYVLLDIDDKKFKEIVKTSFF